MFYNQPIAHRFGKAFADDVESGQWNRIEVAVAWVRRSGTRHLEPPFRHFLRRGGVAQVTVGVEIENTSHEGLKDLLDWQQDGAIEMSDPVRRLERTSSAVIYQAFDGASVLGLPIRQALLHGFAMSPPATLKTVADQTKATWWRFI